jgi:Cu-Zn family superoxide dismutase
MAVAVFTTPTVVGDTVVSDVRGGIDVIATFTKLPPGKHGFHIHVAGDLRGEGCAGACSHWHVGAPCDHGSAPAPASDSAPRHTGDLGNVELSKSNKKVTYHYFLAGVRARELWGRSLIVHADEDDLGLGEHDDSKTTGHSGARIACAVFGRAAHSVGRAANSVGRAANSVGQKRKRRTRKHR